MHDDSEFRTPNSELRKPLRVLVVEDSEDDALMLLRELRRIGYEPQWKRVETREEMEEALRRGEWEIVISDYKMPNFSAPAALETLHESGLDLPFLLCSGTIGEETAVAALKAGAHDFFLKGSLNRLGPAIDRELREVEVRRRRREAEEQARREGARAEALLRIASRLNAQLDLNAVVAIVSEEAAQALGVRVATVHLYDEHGDAFDIAGGYGSPEIRRQLMPVPRALVELATQGQGPVVVIPNLQALPHQPNLDLHVRLDARTLCFAIMMKQGKLVGILSVITFGEERRFTEEEKALLKGMADQAALAISNALLFEASERRMIRLGALRAIDMAITASLDLRVTLNVILDHVTRQLGVDAADILLLDHHTQTLGYETGRGFRTSALRYTRLPLGEGYAGHAALERKIVNIPNLAEAQNSLKRAPLLKQEGFVAYWGVPLLAKGHVKGVLELLHRAPLLPNREWLDFLEALAGQAAIAIDNASLFGDLQRSNVELIQAYDTTLEGWSRALDLRDKETEGHSERVTHLTMRLADVLGIGKAELPHVRRGALLHDIGKMGIPDAILLKPGPLTDEEWVIMRQHPVYAFELLSPISYLRPALDIPYCHHEKWDGTGYPRGLKGEQIPLAARIFGLVDVWDALRSDRPYRPAWSEERALDHIREQSGRHFDPKVVTAFLEQISAEKA